MNDLDELIEVTASLCRTLDLASQNEKKFCQDLCIELERMSWNALCMSNDLQNIKENLSC